MNYAYIVDSQATRYQYSTLSETHVFSPTFLSTARFSYSRSKFLTTSRDGISGPQFSFAPGQEIGTVTVAGLSGINPDTAPDIDATQNIFTWSDDLFYTRGRNSLKFGALINHYQQYLLYDLNKTGIVSFSSVAAFLQAQAKSISILDPSSIPQLLFRYNTLGFYVQDDLRLTSNFTLNLGLRYEFLTTPDEIRNHSASLRDLIHDVNRTIGPPFENPSLENFGPRFGFAWDVMGNGRTAVRGGFAELYDIGDLGEAWLNAVAGNPPFTLLSTVNNPSVFTIPFTIPASAAEKRSAKLTTIPHSPIYWISILQSSGNCLSRWL